MTYGYYPGCSLESTGAEFDISFKAVFSRLGFSLKETKGWTCCGTSAVHNVSHLAAIALPIDNLIGYRDEGLESVVIPCASCFQRFKVAEHEINDDTELRQQVEEVVGSPYHGEVEIIHPLGVLSEDAILERIRADKSRDLSSLKVVCYYGCLLTRPPKAMQFDAPEYPVLMDRILQAAGIKTLDWSYKTDCCGAAYSLTETDVVYRLTNKILKEAKAVGADAVAVACPLCHANLDTRQSEIEEKYGESYGLPIFYFTQLLGMALGIEESELALRSHLVDTRPLVDRLTAHQPLAVSADVAQA